jgi:hypothetical protein
MHLIKRLFIVCLAIVVVAFFAPTFTDMMDLDDGISFAKGKGHGKGKGKGHDRGKGRGHDKDISTPECPDTPDTPDVPDAPVASKDRENGEADAPMIYGCKTSWERATYPECFGLEYHLFLQNNMTGGVAIPVIRRGFDTPNPMVDQ